jgi:Leucine-rich repeat (LRR) protein
MANAMRRSFLVLKAEPDVKLLSYQHNHLQSLQHLEMLPALIFLDCFSNRLTNIAGLRKVSGLRVLMLAQNNITDLSGVSCCRTAICVGVMLHCCAPKDLLMVASTIP